MSKQPAQPTLFDITDSNKPAHAALQMTHPGQAHLANTGPAGATCGECAFLGYFKFIRSKAGNTRRVHHEGRKKFFQFSGKHGAAVPASAAACRHFERKE